MAKELGRETRDGTLYRGLFVWWAQVPLYGFVFVLLAGAALNPDVSVIGRLSCAVGAGLIGAAGVITRRSGIIATREGLVVRRYLGAESEVSWDQVASVRVLPNGNGGGWIAVITTDGRTLRTQGLATNSTKGSWATRMVAAIEAERPQAVERT